MTLQPLVTWEPETPKNQTKEGQLQGQEIDHKHATKPNKGVKILVMQRNCYMRLNIAYPSR